MILIATLLVLSPARIKVACVGASIVAGVGTKDPATQSFPAQLQRYLGASYEVRNFGHSGATLTREGNLPYWSVAEFKAAQEYRPQIVVINLGTNDANPINWEKVKNVFVPEYKELIALFRTLPSHPKVFPTLPIPNYEMRKDNLDFAVSPLVRQVARESGAPLIDFYSPLEGRPELLTDKLHPNEEGAMIMAQVAAEAIEDPIARKKKWRLVSFDGEESGEGPAKNAIDGDTYTYWHTNYSEKETKPPHELVVDMGEVVEVSGLRYLPRQDGGVNGRVRDYRLSLSLDGSNWGEPAASGEMRNSADWTTVRLPKPIRARYFRFTALKEWHNGPWTSVAELDIQRAIGP
jgi:acyl-CoA thioesterase I